VDVGAKRLHSIAKPRIAIRGFFMERNACYGDRRSLNAAVWLV
jgi:hypothetical protein